MNTNPTFPEQAAAAVRKLLAEYPEASLIDIYKSFFQDAYGPGHLIPDHLSARTYLKKELAGVTTRGRTIEPCGLGVQFYRASLDLIADGKVSEDEFFEGFIASADSGISPERDLWLNQWQCIQTAITPLLPVIRNAEGDVRIINRVIRSGSPVMSHSERYRRFYDPHYRIISIHDPLFEKLHLQEPG